MSYTLHEFASRSALEEALCTAVTQALSEKVSNVGRGLLAVSGGSTPAALFKRLSEADLPWQYLTITLVDDRCVPRSSPDSNAGLVLRPLLPEEAKASQASFLPLYDEMQEENDLETLEAKFRALGFASPDVCILGMGNDGHTASLFPCASNIASLMEDQQQPMFRAVTPGTAPWQRITWTLPALMQADRLILHIAGAEKRKVLDQALASKASIEMPIRAFLHHPDKLTEIFWAP